MKSTVKKMLLYIPAGALGLWCMSLQSGILTDGFDAKGLLVTTNPSLTLLWAVTVGYLIAALGLTRTLGGNGTYEENFSKCLLSGSVTILAGCVMGFTGLNGLVPGDYLKGSFAIAAGVCMCICGVFRLMGKKPLFVFDLVIGLYYAWNLLNSYRDWNADPQVQKYAFQLLAGVAAMLFSIHRARCAGGIMDRKKLVFAGFSGIFLSFLAIPGSSSGGIFLASGLWCAGAMCDLRHLEKPEEPREAPAEESEKPKQ